MDHECVVFSLFRVPKVASHRPPSKPISYVMFPTLPSCRSGKQLTMTQFELAFSSYQTYVSASFCRIHFLRLLHPESLPIGLCFPVDTTAVEMHLCLASLFEPSADGLSEVSAQLHRHQCAISS